MSKYAIGDAVVLTSDGAEYGLAGDCEVVTKYCYTDTDDRPYRDDREFFVCGGRGKVVDTRPSGYTYHGDTHDYLVRFDDDPIDERMWWMCCDEIDKVVE
jgi:hypothetical protein